MNIVPIKNYPLITLKHNVVFPSTIVPLIIEGEEMVATINKAIKSDHMVAINFANDKKLSGIGLLGRIQQFWYMTPEVMGATVAGEKRIRIVQISRRDDMIEAGIQEIPSEPATENASFKGLYRSVFDQFKKMLEIEGNLSPQALAIISDENMPAERMTDQIAASLRIDFADKLKLFETLSVQDRLSFLNEKLAQELVIAEAKKSIQSKVTVEVEKVQKEFVLREQLKAIEKELGMEEEQQQFAEFEQKLKQAGMPPEIEKKANLEFTRLKRMPPGSPEISYITNYLDLISSLPWSKKSSQQIDLKKAEEVLNRDHYGLEKVKQRILEYLAVEKMTGGKASGSILCFVGPPGTGKTSVGQSIAKALGRTFARVSIGGIRDESEIRGHRRTYVGAMPGRIIENIKNAGEKNPVFMLDEIDKVGASFMGDPAAALLEVLDPVQNSTFTDHYLDLPFDLSDVLFITTANVIDTIAPTLLDRMEIIEFSGYTNEEKLHIAKKYLLPKVKKESGLSKTDFNIDDDAIMMIISSFTREAGVRELERKMATIARRLVREVVEKQKPKTAIGKKEVEKYLGPKQFMEISQEKMDEIGVATGLAWTPVGGSIISIESSIVPGNQELILTGQLGEIMKESARAALTYLRSRSRELQFDPKFFRDSDVHIHVPAGSVPKDGSSAGIAIAVALASSLTKKKVRKDVAMTGEITLRGKVLPVGGIKEKVVAAYRAGVKTVILPAENEKDLIDVPKEAKDDLKFKFIESADEAIRQALVSKIGNH